MQQGVLCAHPIFQSQKLLYSQFTKNDASLIHEMNHDPAVLRYVHEAPSTLERAQQRLENSILPHYQQYGYGRWAIYLKEDEAFIGWCGLKFRPERNETDLGYRFIQKYWGKGYATEAAKASIDFGFTHLGLPRITATAHIENIASLEVLKKCGMLYLRDEVVDHCPVKSFEIVSSQ